MNRACPSARAGAGTLAVAWDVDGTLVDSEPLHLQALKAVCRAHGVDLSDFGPTPFVGVAAPQVWQALEPRFGLPLGRDPAHRSTALRWAGAVLVRSASGANVLWTGLPNEPFACCSSTSQSSSSRRMRSDFGQSAGNVSVNAP